VSYSVHTEKYMLAIHLLSDLKIYFYPSPTWIMLHYFSQLVNTLRVIHI